MEKSPKASESQTGMPIPPKTVLSTSELSAYPVILSRTAKELEKARENNTVSNAEPTNAAAKGAFHHVFRRKGVKQEYQEVVQIKMPN